jgi:HlyD family secretion protein
VAVAATNMPVMVIAPTPLVIAPLAAPPARQRFPWHWLLLLPPLGAAVWYLGVPLLLGPRVVAVPVVRGTLLRSVVATGQVLTPFRITIGSQITGIVAQVPVAEGQAVTAGQVLVVLDDREAKATLDQNAAALATAEAQLKRLHDVALPVAIRTQRQAEATLLNAERQFARAEGLAAEGFATRVTLDEARAARDVAISQVEAARFQVASDQPGGTDDQAARSAVAEAAANLRAARSRLGYTVITAPSAGTLIARSVEKGSVVQPLATLMLLSPAAPPQLRLQIDERSIGLIKLGQPALVSADVFPKQVFPAVVSYINPGVDAQRASVETKLDVPAPPDWLRQDMTVSVDITVAERKDALMLPLTAVHEGGAGGAWVLRAAAGRAERVPVTLGLRGTREAEILGGVAEHDLVLPTASAVQPGGRVRAEVP